jgi:hypothetical protein
MVKRFLKYKYPRVRSLVLNFKLWDVSEAAFGAGYDGVIIDEVHYARTNTRGSGL